MGSRFGPERNCHNEVTVKYHVRANLLTHESVIVFRDGLFFMLGCVTYNEVPGQYTLSNMKHVFESCDITQM